MAVPLDNGASENDQSPLFAMLALVEAVIDRDQLASAYSEWRNRKDAILADILTEKGWLQPEDRLKVEQLMLRHRRHDLEETQSTLAPEATLLDQDRAQTLGFIASTTDATTVPRGIGPEEQVCALGVEDAERYTLVRLHGEGGVGRVWLARDEKLGREVALKELNPTKALEASAQFRFVDEARVTGQLQHPGIVPVYELSRRLLDQRPFYTMRFLQGQTLTEAVDDYHKLRLAGKSSALELRELLGAFLAVCQVIAYAHSRGVLHRDLKGQNIVMGDFGEVMVLDWGLAKVIGQDSSVQPSTNASDGPGRLSLTRDDSEEKTMEGSVLGTPGYMSPEQAEGRLKELDQRTDVYGLGAILYHVLTGEAPFTGATASSILARVIQEPPTPPRRHVVTVAPELEAICLKCLSKKPSDRYLSASELANDIRNYLADEPVTAYSEPWTRRIRRWLGQHRTFATAAAATLLVATVSLAIAAILLGAANDREAKARAEAEAHFQTARDAVDQFFNKVGDDPRLKAHGLERLRQDLLKQAQSYYEKFVIDPSTRPSVEAERGLTYLQLARITAELGQTAEAIPLAKKARTIFETLARDHPRFSAYQAGFAKAEISLGNDYLASNQVPEARKSFENADRTWERLVRENPSSVEFRYQRTVTLNRLGKVVALVLQSAEEGEKILELSLTLGERLETEAPDRADIQNEKAETLLLLGFSRVKTDFDQARIMLESALKIREKLAEEHPSEPQYQSTLVDTCVFIVVSYSNARVPDRVDEIFNLVRPVSQRLAREHPDVAVFVENDALITTVFATSRAIRGDHEAAKVLAEEAVARNPRSGMTALYAACFYSMASEHCRRDAKRLKAERERLADESLKRAMELLKKARETGLFQLSNFREGLETDPDLAPLRARDEFKRFQAELKQDAATASPQP